MTETFEAYRTRVLSYLGDEEPIGVQQATPSQLDRRLRDVAPAELIRRPAPEKWSIAEIVSGLDSQKKGRDSRGIVTTKPAPYLSIVPPLGYRSRQHKPETIYGSPRPNLEPFLEPFIAESTPKSLSGSS